MFSRSSARLEAAASGAEKHVPNIQNAEDRFSLVELRRIYKELVDNKEVSDENQDLVVEILRIIAEMVVYGDNKSELLFDFFCEKNMLHLFLEIMKSPKICPIDVHIQILQTLSILISCVKNETSLYYLLSNNHINDILIFPHDFTTDESLSAHFASFMKTLSLRLNEQTVQFFFIEDTGAFPLLTKAIQILEHNRDPMIRISAQSTILNVFQVKEERAREYALRPDMLTVFFDAVVNIMKEQYLTLEKVCIQRVKAVNANEDKAVIIKLDQTLEDHFMQIEDWLYYLQDVIDLKIEILERGLTMYLVDHFVCPVLMGKLAEAHAYFHPNSDVDTTGIQSLEIEDKEDTPRVRNSITSGSPKEDAMNDVIQNSIAETVLVYFLEVNRILTSPRLRNGIITALFHPLSVQTRHDLLACHTIEETENVNIEMNSFRVILVNFLHFITNQKIILLIFYNFYCLLNNFKLNFQNNEILLEKNLENFNLLILLQIFLDNDTLYDGPQDDIVLNENNNNLVFNSENFLNEKEILFLLNFQQKHDKMSENLDKIIKKDKTILEEFFLILQNSSNYSIANLLILNYLIFLFYEILFYNLNKINYLKNLEKIIIKLKTEIFIKNCENLLNYSKNHFCDILLVIINEEISRFKNRLIKNLLPKIISDKYLIIPIQLNELNKIIIDFLIPISTIEIIRKECQYFLLLKSLLNYFINFYNNLCLENENLGQNLSQNSDKMSKNLDKMSEKFDKFSKKLFLEFEFSYFINDNELLNLHEENIINYYNKTNNNNSNFDMKGKKFLDAIICNTKSGINTAYERNGKSFSNSTKSNNSNYGSSLLSASASVLTFGMINSNNTSNSTSPNTISSMKSSTNNKNVSTIKSAMNNDSDVSNKNIPIITKVLFVQDPNLLVLVTANKVDGRSTFKNYITTPLLYTDAKVDLQEKRKLKLIVRSWREMDGMNRIEPVETNDNSVVGRSNYNPVTFLLPPIKSTMYELNLLLDTEQATLLAVQHVESRRKIIMQNKLEKLRKILNYWINEQSGTNIEEPV